MARTIFGHFDSDFTFSLSSRNTRLKHISYIIGMGGGLNTKVAIWIHFGAAKRHILYPGL